MFTKKFFTVSEFAKISGVSRQTLIYYDNIGLFCPVSVAENKYRLYSHNQIGIIGIISILSDLGVPLKEIMHIVKNISPKTMESVLNAQLNLIKEKIKKLKLLNEMVELRLESLLLGNGAVDNIDNFSIVNIGEDIPVFIGGKIDRTKEEITDDEMIDFFERSEKEKIPSVFALGYIKEKQNVLSNKEDVVSAMYFRLKNKSCANGFMSAGKYAVGFAHGDYGKTDYIYKKLFEFLKENDLKIIGDFYEEYLHDELVRENPDDFILRLSVQVE